MERLLKLIQLMAGEVGYSVGELADKVGMSVRTVYRYVDTFRSAGFLVYRTQDGFLKMGRESKALADVGQVVQFTQEEALLVNSLLDRLDDGNALKRNIRKKLYSAYLNSLPVELQGEDGRVADCIHRMSEAINLHKQVKICAYSSSNSSRVADRVVEPFAFTANYADVWCYEIASGSVKIFKLCRMGSVELLAADWQHEADHKAGIVDSFRMSGVDAKDISLRIGVRTRNLLVEEYPRAEADLTPEPDGCHWILNTHVAGFAGVGRFVIGLLDDIQVLGSDEFRTFLLEALSADINNLSSKI